ncbi:hypothetical protein V6N11_076705, partial [Hibiscus sabdariffa]
QTLKDATKIAWEDESLRNMIVHNKKEPFYVYVEHKVDIPQYIDYESNDDVDKKCESRVGQRSSGDLGGSEVGEASNVGGSQELNYQFRLCDVNLGETEFKVAFEDVIVEGERSTTFEDVETTSNGEETSNFLNARTPFVGERSSAFEGVKIASEGEEASAFEGKPTYPFVRETEGVAEVHTERETNILIDFVFDTEDCSETEDVGSYENLEDGEVVYKRIKKIFYDPKDRIPCLQLGLMFYSTMQFKDALVEFVVAKRFDYKLVRNEKDKVNAKCKGEGCVTPFPGLGGSNVTLSEHVIV